MTTGGIVALVIGLIILALILWPVIAFWPEAMRYLKMSRM